MGMRQPVGQPDECTGVQVLRVLNLPLRSDEHTGYSPDERGVIVDAVEETQCGSEMGPPSTTLYIGGIPPP